MKQLNDVLNNAAQVMQKTKQDFDKEKLKLGVAGFPGIQERFDMLIEKSEYSGMVKLNPEMKQTLLAGYLAGAEILLNIMGELQRMDNRENAVICLQGIQAELDILLLEQELMQYKVLAKRINNEE